MSSVPASFRLVLSAARAALIVSTVAVAPALRAQSAQPYSIQLAALFTAIKGGNTTITGAGVEPQIRFNRLYATEAFGALSLGLGGQYTSHSKGSDNLKITGIFLEPRYVPAIRSRIVSPYISARLALLQLKADFQNAADGSSTGSGFGLGVGLAAKLTRTANLDAGVQLVRQQFGDIGSVSFKPFSTSAAKIGITLGFPR